ncbi:hypothetical protein TNCV_3477211 [Trichonephila clavipes]|nr:hypothetical protein TNCV_3477211 [Trichonephila clavipes]
MYQSAEEWIVLNGETKCTESVEATISLAGRETNCKLRLPTRYKFMKLSVQSPLPQDYLEESSRTSLIPFNVAHRLAKYRMVVISNTCCSTECFFQSLVYADKPQTLEHLEDNIRRVIADIRPQMLENSSKIGRPDWTTSELDVAVLC